MCGKRRGIIFIVCIMLLSGCGNQGDVLDSSARINENTQAETENITEIQDEQTEESPSDDGEVIDIPQTGMTQAVPDEYLEAAGQQGTVVRVDYDSEDLSLIHI